MVSGQVACRLRQKVILLSGSILQAETCQILSLAEIQDGSEGGYNVYLLPVIITIIIYTCYQVEGYLTNTKVESK